ncbi:C4-dicarboxylate ABC transporter [Methylomarinum sp. Ch1-1]|uniref:C4-dicarboxylate ABC transporter n=1 Tax=Methylomarinum roseum TaxID=3067653 RepID=A0AAU7NPY4_9GAMM|nr:C4-dicarboxylate ABC transporter [Methylomarinum sp. Ch1-1]MDP4521054.1 C4-dicarboxylate ABC transporter [Methylomarinum sp. Ch1-1]
MAIDIYPPVFSLADSCLEVVRTAVLTRLFRGLPRCFIAMGLLVGPPDVSALESVVLNVGNINADDWELRDVSLRLAGIEQNSPRWELQSASMRLPPPLADITGLQISCRQFQWREHYLSCRQGRGKIVSARYASPVFDFSMEVRERRGVINIDHLRLFDGSVALLAEENDASWRVVVNGKDLRLASLKALLKRPELQNIAGRIDLNAELKGRRDNLQQCNVAAQARNLALQALNGKLAAEALTLDVELNAVKKQDVWQWRQQNRLSKGALYVEPLFLDIQPDQPLGLHGNGTWRPGSDIFDVHSATFNHPGVGILEGRGSLARQGGFSVRRADISGRVARLDQAAPIYLTPFLEAGPLAGLELAGQMQAELSLGEEGINALKLDFNDLTAIDGAQRFQLNGAAGQLNWRPWPQQAEPSFVAWRQLKLKAIPVGPGRLDFVTQDRQFELNKQTDVSLLGGTLSIHRFSYAAMENQDADVHFSGALQGLSLAQLSEALDWTPLSGEISGEIPSVTYRNKTLALDGALTMQIFDGVVTIKQLASSGLFTDFAQFYADIDVDNLDLNALTRKFQFGNIEGRLSGYAHNIYLENWRPISFYAWLGTPEDDDSRHRISQKAVENIASLGGGGAANAISKGFMSLFDTFGYDKLGFGCYLHQGVCQMMGVEAADNGYYLIKGGGLPRIDVIGYNPRLDWNVLMQRLRRITASDEVIVE